ncbi:MAG: hypothetical protein HY681_00865 [Chloroflexi bacterium]|nr:hypothetical protein [Chloroflexota bacterium]
MPDLTPSEVESLLKLEGYAIPPQELAELTHRLNALMERLREFDKLDLYGVEPWPVQLVRSDLHA